MSTGNDSEGMPGAGGIDWSTVAKALACGLCGDVTHNTPDSPTCEQCGRILCDECGENIGLCWDHSENPLVGG